MKEKIHSIVESSWFGNSITALIIFNFFTIYASTKGYNMETIELGILAIFTIEVFMKLYAYGIRTWARDGWNLFDATIVTLGILPLLGVPLPKGFAGVRALRLVRLLGRIPATRVLIEAIFKSSSQLGGVGLLSGLFLMIFTLMATQTFQVELPEYFSSFSVSFSTLLTMASFSNLEVIGYAWGVSKLGTLLVFPGFIMTVPLTALNLIIAVLSKAMDVVNDDEEDQDSTENFKDLVQEIQLLRKEVRELKK